MRQPSGIPPSGLVRVKNILLASPPRWRCEHGRNGKLAGRRRSQGCGYPRKGPPKEVSPKSRTTWRSIAERRRGKCLGRRFPRRGHKRSHEGHHTLHQSIRGRRAHEGQGRQHNPTCFETTSAATFDATATMAIAQMPQRAEKRQSAGGRCAAAWAADQVQSHGFGALDAKTWRPRQARAAHRRGHMQVSMALVGLLGQSWAMYDHATHEVHSPNTSSVRTTTRLEDMSNHQASRVGKTVTVSG